MNRNYTVQTKILRPVSDVFDAVVSKENLTQFFVDGASEDLREGATIRWRWDHYGENPVVVRAVEPQKRIVLALDSAQWDKTKNEAYEVLVTFDFEALDEGATMLSISESGWRNDLEGLKASHENCSGWTHMAACLKAWIEHGIDLRSF